MTDVEHLRNVIKELRIEIKEEDQPSYRRGAEYILDTIEDIFKEEIPVS